jgi:cytochrome c biogenesis protein CcmG/thiol:disulfide interchange protein DsbE
MAAPMRRPRLRPTRSAELVRRIAALVAVAVLAGCQHGGGAGAVGGPSGDEHPLVGVAAPEFELPAQSGGHRVSLSAGNGKVTIVDFWATWCEPCKESFPAYQKLVDEHRGKLEMIGISEDDSPAGIKKFAKATGVSFALAWDDGQTVSKQYQPPTMPTSYVIDENGIVRFVHAGYRSGDEQELESMIQSLAK